MMAASQRSQLEAFQELTTTSKDKANDAMFALIKVFDDKNRQAFEDWIDEINQVSRGNSDSLENHIAFPFGVCRKLLMDMAPI